MVHWIIRSLFFISLVCFVQSIKAQQYQSYEGQVILSFTLTIDEIQATNTKGTSLLDTEAQEIAFLIPVSSFEFSNELMQEHFIENYMEVDKFPNATFAGKWEELEEADQVKVIGDLTIHGITQNIETEGNIQATGTNVIASTKFVVNVADFGVKDPRSSSGPDALKVKIEVNFKYQ